MKWKLCQSCIFTAAVLVLPGCLAINAVLGVLGYFGTGPIQLAGTAYSISEYTYEYAVNDKTPDEVIEEKFAWLLLPEGDLEISGYARATRKSGISPPMDDIAPEMQLAKSPMEASQAVPLTPGKQKNEPALMTASLMPSPQIKPAATKPGRVEHQRNIVKKTVAVSAVSIAKVVIPKSTPQHTYVDRETDPLLAKLDRLELTFRQAEDIVSKEPSQGILLSAQSYPTPMAEQGISGSWSIRHRLMERPPS